MKAKDPRLPLHYSKADAHTVEKLLDEAHKMVTPYSSNWKAPWLLSPIESPDWILGDGNSWYENGKWHGVRQYHWSYRLPDGTLLSDSENSLMLESCQKIAFLWRTLPEGFTSNNFSLVIHLSSLSVFVRWLYLHESIYKPKEYGFLRIDHAALRDFFSQFVQGGAPWALGYPWQLLIQWYGEVFGTRPPAQVVKDPFKIGKEDRRAIAKWLEAEGYFKEPIHGGGRYLDRQRLADELSCDVHSIKTHARFAAFLRLFEPTVESPLMKRRNKGREFPSHRTPTVAEVAGKKIVDATAYIDLFRNLLDLRPYLPEMIPDTTDIHLREVVDTIQRGDVGRHTPWIPMKIALAYTQEALRWVHVYGDALVDTYLEVCRCLQSEGRFQVNKLSPVHRQRREQRVKTYGFPSCLSPIGIDGWTSKLNASLNDEAYRVFRAAPSLNDSMGILIGAIIMLLSILKPIRSCELTELKRGCVLYAQDDGYWLSQDIAKATVAGERGSDDLPIPRIVAQALLMVDRLGEGMRELVGNSPTALRDCLFYLPPLNMSDTLQADRLKGDRARKSLDRFCDWVNLPCDEQGRRWYVRIHECRKSFLITFFWSFRYASLDAARWIAGHRDARDVYAYIQANFPGKELPEIESQYATQQLWLHESRGESEVENAEELYQAVCRHFSVRSINLVSEQDLSDWLELAFLRGTYSIRPYTVRVKGHIVETRICFRIGKEGDRA